jgi:hypothetical protein
VLDVNLEFHPAANVFPLLEGQDLKVLVDTMRERGYETRRTRLFCLKTVSSTDAIGI